MVVIEGEGEQLRNHKHWRTVLHSPRTPLEVKILKDYIKDWKESRGGILLFPKDHLHFDRLLLQNRFILFDRLLDSSGTIQLVPKEKMDEDSKRKCIRQAYGGSYHMSNEG